MFKTFYFIAKSMSEIFGFLSEHDKAVMDISSACTLHENLVQICYNEK